MNRDLLFEIGLEEVPARFMPEALQQLKQKAAGILKENRLKFEEINSYGTPRRLVLYIKGLETKQQDLVEESRGPSKQVAFDDEGNPTKAALGFAKGCGIDVNDLVVKETQNGSYVFAQVKKEGKNTIDILPEILKNILFSLSFPKPMRWGNSNIRFIRPIRWLLALYDKDVVSLQIEDVKSDNKTRGHRFLSSGEIEISSPDEYFDKLRNEYVIVDPTERKEMIWKGITAVAEKEEGRVKEDNELLEEVNYLIEYPAALCGNFNNDFLNLPQEVLITPMKEHQRYFPVWDKEEKQLLPKFITVRNGISDYIDTVTAGNEKVLRARLSDAQFFYDEDVKTPLEEKVEKLQDVVFQEKLGTIYNKVERIKDLSADFADKIQLSAQEKNNCLRCAYLAKADLVTSMVDEFSELQGIMGGYYAEYDGEDKEVSKGITEHYMPRYAGDDIPRSTAGTVVAIADKIDTITGCFAIGIQPTGSQDPYALRRQAQGICYMIKENNLNLRIQELVEKAYEKYASNLNLDISLQEVQNEMEPFFKQRIANILKEDNIEYDIVNSILSADWDDGANLYYRASALSNFRQKEEFEELKTAFNRAGNLAQKAEMNEVEINLFEDKFEKELWNKFQEIKEKASLQIEKGNYFDALNIISELRLAIDNFFDNVMVMVDDEKIKNNRLALLKQISDFMFRIADFSQIVS